MRCVKARRRLSARADGALHERHVPALDGHLAACPACAAFARSLEETAVALRRWSVDEPCCGFADRVLARVAGEGDRPRRWRPRPWRERLAWLRPAPVGLAAAAFVLGVLLSASMDAGGERRSDARSAAVVAGADTFDPLPQDSAGARLLELLGDGQE